VQVLVNSKSRQYVVDTATRQIVQMRGRGAPPTDANAQHIIEEAMRAHASGLKEMTLPDARNIPAPRGITVSTASAQAEPVSDDQLMASMNERYDMFCNIVEGATHGEFPAAIISGSPGMC
jgi:hypothetical protein